MFLGGCKSQETESQNLADGSANAGNLLYLDKLSFAHLASSLQVQPDGNRRILNYPPV